MWTASRCLGVLAVFGAAVIAQETAGATRMRMQILPDRAPPGVSVDSTASVLGRLREAVAVGEDGSSAADAYGGLLGDIQPETLTATTARDTEHAAVDIVSDGDVRTHAEGLLSVQAGGKFRGRIQARADVAVGGLELQSLGNIESLVGDDAALEVLGDVGIVAAQTAGLRAAQLSTTVMGSSRLAAGADVGAQAGGDAALRLGSASASVKGDLSVSGAKLNLAGTKGLSMIAGAGVDVATPGGVKLAGRGSSAEIGGDGQVEFVAFVWRSTARFDVYDNTLPEAVAAVVELLIRANRAGSAAEVSSDAGGASVSIALGETDASGAVSFDTVWGATIGTGAFSLDGLQVSLSEQHTVSTIRLSSAGGDNVFRGWSEVEILLGVGAASGVRVATAANLEATAAKGMRLVAQQIAASASSDLDVSASSSARVVAGQDLSVAASDKLRAVAASLDVQAADGIEAFSGGTFSASVGSVEAESRGDAALTAADDLSLAAESGELRLSGDLAATATNVKLNTGALETSVQDLSVGASEAASLHTTDASLSASGSLSAYMGEGQLLSEGDFALQSGGDVSVRSPGSILLDTADDMTVRTAGDLVTTTGTMRMRAGGGATPSSSRAEVEIDCEGADGGCSGKEQQLREELADMLGVPLSRLRVSSV